MSIAAFSIKRRITVLMAALGVLVFGGFSLNRLELKLLPEINYPALTVRTELEGAPPEEVEDLVSRPIEEVVGVINNLQQVTSISRAGLSDVVIEFHWNTEMDKALMDVREKLDTIILPDAAERPRILRYNPETEPILKLSLTGDDLVAMHTLAENEIKPRLETLEGVAAAHIVGGEEEEILIELDTQRLAALDLDLNDVSLQLSMENVNSPGGMLQEGNTQFLVRTVNEFETVDDIAGVVIGTRDGVDVRLGDVASIRRTLVERKALTHLDGQDSVLIDIYKEGDANIISVTDAVRAELGNAETTRFQRVKSLRNMLPETMKIAVISDQSVFIRAAINEVRTAAVLGCLLAVVVLFFFMRNLSNTIIIALSIPVSIIATFTLMYFQKISLNLMSLGGLALGIGMLVDNSIVVLENIFRLKEDGKTPVDASRIGTEQVTTAVIASTLTTIAVFFPILFVKGIAGQIFNDLAWTIAFSLLASLIVALSLIPMIASLGQLSNRNAVEPIQLVAAWTTYRDKHPHTTRFVRGAGNAVNLVRLAFRHILATAREQLRFAFKSPGGTAGFAGITLLVLLFPFRFVFHLTAAMLTVAGVFLLNGSWVLIALPVWLAKQLWSLLQWVLSPALNLFNRAYNQIHRVYLQQLKRSLNHPFRAPLITLLVFVAVTYFCLPRLGMNLIPQMSQGEFLIDLELPVGSPLEMTRDAVRQVETGIIAMPEIQSVSAIIGSDMTASTALGAEQEHMATIQVLLKQNHRTRAEETRVINRLRDSMADMTRLESFEFRRPALFTLKTPLEVEVRSNDLNAIMEASRKVTERMGGESSFRDITNTMETGYPEIEIVFDRVKLARLGMTPYDAAEILKTAVEGSTPTEFGKVGEEIDIRIRADRILDLTVSDLDHLVINPESDTPVYLNAVANITRTVGPGEIRRVDQRRVALIRIDAPMTDLKGATRKARDILETIPETPGVYYAVTGQTEEMEESTRSLTIALIMAIFLVYLVMASQFESLVQPFIILFSIPMALIGVLLGLFILEIPLSVVVFIGLIVLAGIVVNNAIVLVDRTNQLYRGGTPLADAVLRAGDQRLRPILMTALTTILGLLPMAVALGAGQEIRQPLAVTVILGMLISTFMTLLVIPTIYYLIHKRSGDRRTAAAQGDAGGH